MITDTDRMNFLDRKDRKWTFWLGINTSEGSLTAPVFKGESIRKEIDKWILREKNENK